MTVISTSQRRVAASSSATYQPAGPAPTTATFSGPVPVILGPGDGSGADSSCSPVNSKKAALMST